jgi:hypothetical protein
VCDGGPFCNVQNEGSLLAWRGARHADAWERDCGVGLGHCFNLQGRLPVSKFPGSRKAVERQHGKASSAMFLQIRMLFGYFSRPPSEMEVLHFRQHLLKPTARRQWLDVDTCLPNAFIALQHMGGSSQ